MTNNMQDYTHEREIKEMGWSEISGGRTHVTFSSLIFFFNKTMKEWLVAVIISVTKYLN